MKERITDEIQTQIENNLFFSQVFFVPVMCFITYNLFDVVGKQLASWQQWPGTSTTGQTICLVASVARIVFIPLFMFCNVAPTDRKTEVRHILK